MVSFQGIWGGGGGKVGVGVVGGVGVGVVGGGGGVEST